MINPEQIDFSSILETCIASAAEHCPYQLEENSIEKTLFASEMYFYFLFTLPNYISAMQLKKITFITMIQIFEKGTTALENYIKDKHNISLDLLEIQKQRFTSFLNVTPQDLANDKSKNINPLLFLDLNAQYSEIINNYFSNDCNLYHSERDLFSEQYNFTMPKLKYNKEQPQTFVSMVIDNWAIEIAKDLTTASSNLETTQTTVNTIQETKSNLENPKYNSLNNSEPSGLKTLLNSLFWIFIVIGVLIIKELPRATYLVNKASTGGFSTQNISNTTPRTTQPVSTINQNENLPKTQTSSSEMSSEILIDTKPQTKALTDLEIHNLIIQANESLHADNYEKTIELTNKIIESNAKNAEAYTLKGIARVGLGDYDDVASEFTKAIEINPDYTLAYLIRGELRYEAGYYDEALVDLYKAKELATINGDQMFVDNANAFIEAIIKNQKNY